MITWRPINADDREAYVAMATAFYGSDAVLHPIPETHIINTFDEMMRSDVYATGQICEYDGEIVGYVLFAKTFSQEAGGLVLWVEELYIKEEFRGKGIGSRFLAELIKTLPEGVKRIRLETERDNEGAVKLYTSLGFTFLDYDQMIFGK